MNVDIIYFVMCFAGMGGWTMASFVIDKDTYPGSSIRLIGIGIVAITMALFLLMRIGRKRVRISQDKIKYDYKLAKFQVDSCQSCYVLAHDGKKEFHYVNDDGHEKIVSCPSRRVSIRYSYSDNETDVKVIVCKREYQYRFLFIRWQSEVEYTNFYELTISEDSIIRM